MLPGQISKMKTFLVRTTGLLSVVLLALSASCSASAPAPPPLPLTTTTPAPTASRAETTLAVGGVRMWESNFLYFHGTTKLPDATPLASQLYESGQGVPWWPAVLPIFTNNGTWEARVPLGINGAPAKLAVGPQYLFKVWQVTDPSVQGSFSFDLVGPPPARGDAWWQRSLTFVGDFFSDLFHGRLWRTPAPRTPGSPIDRDIALTLAAKSLPADVIKEASKSVTWDEGVWRVIFFLPHTSVTKDQLGWSDSPGTSFDSHGWLPSGSFSTLTFDISATSGAILSRQASDSIIVGPMDGMPEMPDNRVPPWTNIASGIGGLLVGGAIVWLAMRLRRRRLRQRPSTSEAGDE